PPRRRRHEDEPETDRAHTQLGGDRRVRIRTKVPPGDPTLDDPGHLAAAASNDDRPERVADRRVASDLRQHRADDRAPRGSANRFEGIACSRAQLGTRVADIGNVEMWLGQAQDQIEGQSLLRRPAAIDRSLADPGPGRDVLEPETREALLDEQVPRGPEDRPVCDVTSWSTRRARVTIGVTIPGHPRTVRTPRRTLSRNHPSCYDTVRSVSWQGAIPVFTNQQIIELIEDAQ